MANGVWQMAHPMADCRPPEPPSAICYSLYAIRYLPPATLAAVVLDDQLLVQRQVDGLAIRRAGDTAGHPGLVELQPFRHSALAQPIGHGLEIAVAAAGGAHLDDVADFHQIGGHVVTVPVEHEMPVTH